MYDIKQITNYDLQGFDTEVINGTQYAVIPASFLGVDISKLSYCVTKPSGIGSSFYITVNNETFEIIIGKTGMYELNIEQYFNNQVNQTKIIEVKVTQLKLPISIPFVLDYATFGVTNSAVYKKIVKIPTQKGNPAYTGKLIYPSFYNYSSKDLIIMGETEAIEVGQHIVTFKLRPDTVWEDGTVEDKKIPWYIEKGVLSLSILPHQNGKLTYNKEEQSPVWSRYDKNKLDIRGEVKGTNAKTYIAYFYPTKNYTWEDGTTEKQEVQWEIEKAALDIVTNTIFYEDDFIYDGEPHFPNWQGLPEYIEAIFEPQTDAGSYYTQFRITNENYYWNTGSSSGYSYTDPTKKSWYIKPQPLEDESISIIQTTFEYDGQPHMPILEYDATKIKVEEYTNTYPTSSYYSTSYHPEKNYCWKDGNTYSKYIYWKITKKPVPLPIQTNQLLYNGTSQLPEWEYDTNSIYMYSSTGQINAGTYYTQCYLKDSSYYCWEDDPSNSSTRSIPWTIAKIKTSFSVAENEVIFNDNNSYTIPIEGEDLKYVAISANPLVAISKIENKNLIITPIGGGETTITVSIFDVNVECESEQVINITSNLTEINIPLKSFSEATDDELFVMGEASRQGLINLKTDAGWKVGDERKVQFYGTQQTNGINSQSSNELTFIILNDGGYDLVEPIGEKTQSDFIIGMKNCFSSTSCIKQYSTTPGWRQIEIRSWCNNQFKEALAPGFKSLFKLTKVPTINSYSDGKAITNTEDYFFLPTEYEIRNANSYSYTEERPFKQWDYCALSTNNRKKRASEISSSYTQYWTRSLYRSGSNSSSYNGVTITSSGGADYWNQNSYYGISVAGCV